MPTRIARQSLCAALVASAVASMFAVPAMASSHREAPFITQMPKVDGTDFYMFQSYDASRPNTTTLIADYVPLQDAYGGPNYFAMDPSALYEIHIDNTGKGKESITYQFRFNYENKNATFPVFGKDVSIPLVINGGGDISTPNSPNANVRETYSVNVVYGDRRAGTQKGLFTNANGGSSVFDKPLDNIGNKSISNYAAYAAKHVYSVNIPGCTAGQGRIFVGQRKDPFVVNLGRTFDLVNIAAPVSSGPVGSAGNTESAGKDDLADKNVTSIEMEIPTACLLSQDLVAAGTPNAQVIGGWTTASVRQGRLINPTPTFGKASKEGGAWTQVSRLGMPLVNELVIGLKDKDKFNHSKPEKDSQFGLYVTNPVLPALIEALFGTKAPNNIGRGDLVATFLTGIKGINQQASITASEMLRLDTAVAPKAPASQLRLGVIGGDGSGFPNGRRPGDDVVDITLRVAMGRLCTLSGTTDPFALGCGSSNAPSGNLDFTDGAFVDASKFDATFPYLKTPLPGSVKP